MATDHSFDGVFVGLKPLEGVCDTADVNQVIALMMVIPLSKDDGMQEGLYFLNSCDDPAEDTNKKVQDN